MNPAALILVMLVVAQPVTACLALEDNSIDGDYCTVSCSGDIQTGCTIAYSDTGGVGCDLLLRFVADDDLDGAEVEIAITQGDTVRRLQGTFDLDEFEAIFYGMPSGGSVTLKATLPPGGVPVRMTVTAVPDGTSRSSAWLS
jgi:hypothetical protein